MDKVLTVGRLATLPAIAVLAMYGGVATAQSVLDFEGLTEAQVSTQYSNLGVTLQPGVPLRSYEPGFAHSGTKALELCFAAEFCKARLIANFTTGQTSVKLFVGTSFAPPAPIDVKLEAYNASGIVVGTAVATLAASPGQIPVTIPLEVTSSSANIVRISAGSVSDEAYNNGLVFDDLTISAAGPQAQCNALLSPVATLAEPVTGTAVQINSVLLRGSVSTPGAPLQSATLTISGPNNQQSSSDLLGSLVQPMGGNFGPTNLSGSLFPGTNTLTFTARNCRGSNQRTTIVEYGPAAPGTQLKLLGMEISQATQDPLNSVPLTAGKPTLLRLYFATTGTVDLQSVRGDVLGYKEGGNTPFLAQSVGQSTITPSTDLATKRGLTTGSMNFLLSPDFYGPGKLNFRVDRLYVDGPGGATLACDGCKNWTADFPQMPPLNLVVQPYFYMKSMKTADSGVSLLGALRYLNNVFPLRGDFPIDDSGLRLTLLLPQRTLALDTGIGANQSRILYELSNILDDLKADSSSGVPQDAFILGIGPSGAPGGFANFNTSVAYGDSRATEDTALVTDPEFYGAIWAQEIGHALGLPHVSDSHGEMSPTDTNFPYAHGGIGEPGTAIGTAGWNGTPYIVPLTAGAAHAHDFMSYGESNGNNSFSWVSPYTYRNIRTRLVAVLPAIAASAAAAPAVEKIVVGGTIDGDGKVSLAPSKILRTAYAKGTGESGSLTISLLGASGASLGTYSFDPKPVIPGRSSVFNEFVPWNSGTRTIVLSRGGTVLERRNVTAASPSVSAVRTRLTDGTKLRIEWGSSDGDGDQLTYDVHYSSGLDGQWIPLAIQVTETSTTIDTSLLPVSNRSRIRVRASDGVNSGEAETLVRLPRSKPLPVILNVQAGTGVSEAKLEGSAYDPQQGLLSGARLRWTSDRDGELGTGRVLQLRRLSSGRHMIRLTATNDAGVSVSAERRVDVP